MPATPILDTTTGTEAGAEVDLTAAVHAVNQTLAFHAVTDPDHVRDVLRRVGSPYGIPVGMKGNSEIKTRCNKGHPYTDGNTYWPPSGGRHCRQCTTARHRQYQREARERRLREQQSRRAA